MTVPPAAVNENDLSVTRKDDIRTSRKIRSVEAKPIAQAMHQSSNRNFGCGIVLAYARHAVGSLLRCKHIHDKLSPEQVFQNEIHNANIDSIPQCLETTHSAR